MSFSAYALVLKKFLGGRVRFSVEKSFTSHPMGVMFETEEAQREKFVGENLGQCRDATMGR